MPNLIASPYKFSLFIAIFSFAITFISEYFFTGLIDINLILALGTGFCTFIAVLILRYLLFFKLKRPLYRYILLIAFPLLYMILLISFFGTITTIQNFKYFNVSWTTQLYIQGWQFLGQSFVYLAFSPRLPFVITNLAIIILFYQSIKKPPLFFTNIAVK